MRVDSLDYYTDNIHIRLVFTARVAGSNETRASLRYPVAGGTFSAWMEDKLVGNGTFDGFTLARKDTDVVMILDQSGVPLDRGPIVKRFVAGGSIAVSITVRKMKFWIAPIGVTRTANATLSIEDTVSSSSSGNGIWD